MTSNSRKAMAGIVAGTTLALAISPLTPAVAGSPSTPAASPTVDRGDVLSATVIKRLTVPQARRFLKQAGYPTSEVRRPLVAHRLTYRTVTRAGKPTRASGLVAFPTTGPRRLEPVLWTHGTTPSDADAPSVGTGESYQQAGALAFAAAGYAVVAPDYLGLGAGAGRPAYLDSRTERTASLDLLTAARSFARTQGRRLKRGVNVAGYSQGAHAALVNGRAIQEGQAPGSRLAALAPISGAYAFREAELPALVHGEVVPKLAALYLGYLLTSWDRMHGLYGSPREAFRAPYAGFVTGLYDGSHSGMEVYQRMPDSPAKLLTPRWMKQLRNPSGAFLKALRAYDDACRGWVPKAPTRMYYTGGDQEAVPANTLHCANDFARSGYGVRTHDLRVRNHSASGTAGAIAAIRFFRHH